MKYKNYYAILEVNRKSSDQDIKLNFRRLAKEYHPDKNKTPGAEEKFKDINALENVSMTLESGKIYGFVGHNGSGKTVLLKLICAFLEPSTGEILFDGVNVIKENSFPPSTRALIERPNFLSDLTGKENLELLARIQNKIGEKEIEETLEKVGLKQVENRLYYKYWFCWKYK